MFDLNAIISTAITQAVDSHVRGLVAAQDLQTQALEQMQVRLNDMTVRLEMLSASVHGADARKNIEQWAEETFTEWAEEVVTDERFMRKLIGLLDFDDVVSNALDNIDLAEKFDVKDAVNDALGDMDLLDSIEDDAFSDKVKEVLGEMTFSLDIK